MTSTPPPPISEPDPSALVCAGDKVGLCAICQRKTHKYGSGGSPLCSGAWGPCSSSGARLCIDGIYSSGAAFCMHNPCASATRRVAVVGAGPAGLEASRVLAERVHDVHLFVAADKVGGQLLLASLAPRRRDLRGIIDWRTDELARLSVPISLNTYADAPTLLSQSWDVVIVATGGTPAAPRIPGAGLVHDTWDVLSGARRLRGV